MYSIVLTKLSQIKHKSIMKKVVINTKSILLYFMAFSFILTMYSCGDDSMTDGGGGENENEIPTLEDNLIIDESRLFVNYVIPQAQYDIFLADEADYSYVSQKVYEHFKDDFDFIFIFADEDEKPDGVAFGRNRSVKLDIDGLGGVFYDNTAAQGSAGRLKSVMYMPLVRYIRNGPFLHEIAHHWANKDFVPTTVSGHWGYSSAGGQLGGFDELEDLGNGQYLGKMNGNDGGFGTFANGGNSIPYSNAELYLMGMIPESELEEILVAENPQNEEGTGVFSADAITTYTPADLIAQHGPRSPAFNASQKEFRGISVIISTSPISAERIEMAKSNLENFVLPSAPEATDWGNSNNFWMATRGVGSFDFTINNNNVK